MISKKFDIVIIGGGHAGIEASWIAAQIGVSIALITNKNVKIGETPCNPAIGGVGKGHLVREIDAMGGLMGRLADEAAIHYKVLNESKGYAVRSTRVQVDKEIYAKNAENYLEENNNISIIRDSVIEIIPPIDGSIFIIKLKSGEEIKCFKLVICSGTFLDGKIHIGSEQLSGGTLDSEKSVGLQKLCKFISSPKKRFKTGTPARLDKNSINWSVMRKQPSDALAASFHVLNKNFDRKNPQIACYITDTNKECLEHIRKNKEHSPIFNGQIVAIGPRYCPSIEDKAFRYPNRNEHHIFVEKEGLNCDSVYPNGISTSLPKNIQEEFIKKIPGFENCKIIKYGHAVEYDVVDPTTLDYGLQYKDIAGLYFAGQINGTSGYEEAAAQGLVAGLNAALSLKQGKNIEFCRSDSYIGVLIEDIISNFRDEPYRLFTARAENRLFIREDNSIDRIGHYRASLKLNEEIDKFQKQYHWEKNTLK